MMPKSTSSAYQCRLPFCTRENPPAVRRLNAASPCSEPSNSVLVAESQEDAVRDPEQRAPDQRVVRLVDVVLAGKDAVQRREAGAQPLGALGGPAEHERGGSESGEGEHDRHDDERRLVVLERGTMSGSGSSGSRKCGIDRKPPIADSTASTVSTASSTAATRGRGARPPPSSASGRRT
jgi:hypothetical protein